jgi:RHS repeat-associated protein
MNRLSLKSVLLLALLLSTASAQGQIAFRAASSATASGITPAFRAAASATTTGATLTITKPSGTATNDVLVASIAVTPSTATITPPSGWTLVRRLDNAGPTANSLAVYYKAAAASEPASYAWGVSGSSFTVGGIQGFTGIDTASPLDIENGQSTPSGTTHATPSITTSVANAMLVASHAFASSQSWTPPSGMTESFDQRSGANNATGLSIEGSRVLLAVAGASGTKTATAAGSADAGNAHLLALRPAKANLAISTPAGTAANDVMIAAIGFNNASAAITPPAGWTLVRRTNNASTTSNSLAVYRKTAATGEPASHTWGVAGGAFLVGGIQSFSGVDTANPIDAESGQSTVSGTNHDTPSITTSTANTMLVTSHTYASSQSWTPQAGLTESFDRPSGTASATGQSITGTRQTQAAAGATGTKRSTAASSADVGNTHILALRRFIPNVPPTVSLTSPTSGATFTAPASITLTATAADSDGTIQKVDFFHGGTNLIATITAAPFTFAWTGVAQGSYTLTAVATDNLNASTTSAPVSITVDRAPALQFVHVDHLNTPRLITDANQQVVWRLDQQEPFGDTPPDENPSELGAFKFPLRSGGWQYADDETGELWNWYRTYSKSTGRFDQFDPIGLYGGLNGFAFVNNNPLRRVDPMGLFTGPVHEEITRGAAKSCPKLAGTLPSAVNAVDSLAGSQLPGMSFMHGMCAPGQTPSQGMTQTEEYIEQEIAKCSAPSLAKALHAGQDKHSPSHRNCQTWPGRGSMTMAQLMAHAAADRGTEGRAEAGMESEFIIARFKVRCPCLCE